MIRSANYEVEVEVNDLTFRVTGSFTPGSPGRYSGPPEACYPEIPDEFELGQVYLLGEDEEEVYLPTALLDAVYVGERKLIAGLDGKVRDYKLAGPTLADAIKAAALERVQEVREKEARAADDDAHGDWLADRGYRG